MITVDQKPALEIPNNTYYRVLLCGRFYPYHKGHKYLIETALQKSQVVCIIVCQRNEQTVLGKQRAQWIKQSFPKQFENNRLQLFVLDQDQRGLPDRGAQQWAQAVLSVSGFQKEDIQAVFTSEAYQKEFANLLEADLVLVDPARKVESVSGSLIRSQAPGYQQHLEGHVLADIKDLDLADDQKHRSDKFNYQI
jgi:cytidyltransferase-like protein